jgi:hypothetical protein
MEHPLSCAISFRSTGQSQRGVKRFEIVTLISSPYFFKIHSTNPATQGFSRGPTTTSGVQSNLSPVPSFVLIFPVARLARTVVAGLPHHVTQRGNRREAIFFEDGDQEVYRDLLAEQTRKAELRCGRTVSCPIMFTSFSSQTK